MATSKTLAPTNVTISIPAMTDQPNASVLANCADKEADAINALNSQLSARFNNTAITSMSDLISYFGTYKIGLTRVSNTVGNLLSGHNRTGLCIGFEITSEYSAFIFLDSNGETYSGWITNATGAVVYNQL